LSLCKYYQYDDFSVHNGYTQKWDYITYLPLTRMGISIRFVFWEWRGMTRKSVAWQSSQFLLQTFFPSLISPISVNEIVRKSSYSSQKTGSYLFILFSLYSLLEINQKILCFHYKICFEHRGVSPCCSVSISLILLYITWSLQL
jgi:hypothetical protein